MNRRFSFIFSLLLVFVLSGCARTPLSLFSVYVSKKSLASYYVKTPDPALLSPDIGQRLYVRWDLKKDSFIPPLSIALYMHFGDRSTLRQQIPVSTRSGTYCYELLNEEFAKKRGICSYKAELSAAGVVIHEWKHQLWVEKVLFPEEEQSETKW